MSLLLVWAAGCNSSIEHIEEDFGFDGTCVRCHSGLSSGQVHAGYKLRCIDCHGGKDQVFEVPQNAALDPAIYRDHRLIAASHVQVKQAGLARFFWANGVDDDGDGVVDEGPDVTRRDAQGAPMEISDLGEIAEPGLHGEGIGEFVDSEYNRDLNYTRWLNPGDLRVAKVGCGSESSAEGGTGCHQRVVDSMRRSIMVTQAAVINGAYYGNESQRPAFRNARDANGPAADPRRGAFGYVLDFGIIDGCIDTSELVADPDRGQPSFDSECLERTAADKDPNALADVDGNRGLPSFEAVQGSIRHDESIMPGQTALHQGVKQSRFSWGGKQLMDPGAPLAKLEHVPDELLPLGPPIGPIPDPIDTILRGFRAYYPMNYPGSARNFDFTFGESILPNIDIFKTKNPFGRGHSSGCTSCHMLYRNDGTREPQLVGGTDSDGTYHEELVSDPTTKHREFDPEKQDRVRSNDVELLVGMTVSQKEREDLEQWTGEKREQQRFYSAKHELTTRIPTQQCGLCHGFVTRIDMAYQGMAEDEQRDALARDRAIQFTTPGQTNVRILSSWIYARINESKMPQLVRTPDLDASQNVIDRARERDQLLTELGLPPGAGGCAPEVYTEDCNNNGELDRELVLRRVDERGNIIAEAVVDEDLNNNGMLDLIDHAPREASIDGRQPRYVYGGANGSTRLMDIHFERGMHCIDCHMLQDSHGDGNLYHTNWEAIEIECEDCHGAASRATLITSGANGGNDLRKAVDHDGRPYFEIQNDRIIQRSRVTPGLFWEVPQLPQLSDPQHGSFNPLAAAAHDSDHLPPPVSPTGHNQGSSFAGVPGHSELTGAKLECYTCHSSWVLNCMGCHTNTNQGDRVIDKLLPFDPVTKKYEVAKVAGENEVWFNNKNQTARTNFQLLAFMRSPFVLALNAAADGQRLAPFRSSMQVHLSLSDPDGHTIIDNATFTTFQDTDANSGRSDVATSGAAMNQTMPHTVRPREVRDCDQCHSLVDGEGRIRNDHILAETYGLGAGRYPYLGDWALVAGRGGLALIEYKAEHELKGSELQENESPPGKSTRFPGLVVDGSKPSTIANVEPALRSNNEVTDDDVTDVVLIRNFTLPPGTDDTLEKTPTLRDLAVMTVNRVEGAMLVISDITLRGHPVLARRSRLGIDTNLVFHISLPGRAEALAHLAPDVSDPFVYVAAGSAGLVVVPLVRPPTSDKPSVESMIPVPLPEGRAATEIVLAGDIAYVGTDKGTIEIYNLNNPRQPEFERSVSIIDNGRINGLAVAGFMLYAATDRGLAILDISVLDNPRIPTGATAALALPTAVPARELFYAEGHVYLAAGSQGVLDIDVTTPAMPRERDRIDIPADNINAQDVVVTKVPGQTWILVADGNSGSLYGYKLDNSQSTRERCFPNTQACSMDMDFRDPTIMGRDPELNGPTRFVLTSNIVNKGRRLARPAYWEKLGTHTGRRYRDSFMPGSGVLSYPIMRRMYEVKVCEIPNTIDRNGNGLGELTRFDESTGMCSTSMTAQGRQATTSAPARVTQESLPAQLAHESPPDELDGGMCLIDSP